MQPDQSSGIGMAPTARGLAGTTKNQGEQCGADVHGTRFTVAGNLGFGTAEQAAGGRSSTAFA